MIATDIARQSATAAPLGAGPGLAQPRARGELRIAVRSCGGRTRLRDLRQAGSLKALFPRPHGDGVEAVFLNTAGGLTGGDRLRIEAEVAEGAHLVLSSQAAERGYRAQPGEIARQEVQLSVAKAGWLEWLPQETILFEGAALERRLSVSLEPSARALIVEPLVLGRLAMGEALRDLWFRDRWELRLGGRLIFADAVRLVGDAAGLMDRAGIGGGARALATVLYRAPDAAGRLAAVRAMLPATAGASLLAGDLMVLRLLARDGFALRQSLVPVVECLKCGPVPKVWRL